MPSGKDFKVLYVLIVEDRHVDVEVSLYLSKEKAIKEAESIVKEYDYEDEENEGLNKTMIERGWIYHAVYSCEGDCVRVVERAIEELDK